MSQTLVSISGYLWNDRNMNKIVIPEEVDLQTGSNLQDGFQVFGLTGIVFKRMQPVIIRLT